MSQPNDLMGLGLPPLLAGKIADAGQGNLTAAAAGSTFATSTKIAADQNMLTCVNANGTLALGLPVVGGDTLSLGDQYVVSNTGTTSLQLFGSTGVLINVNGSNNSQQPILQSRTMILWPVSTTQWLGINGS